MRIVKWYLDTGFECARHEGEFEIEDSAAEEKIEEKAKEEAFNEISWGWEFKEGG